jgi:hypothetical protein
LVFHEYMNEMHGSRSKIPSTKSRPYIRVYVKFLALLGAPYIYDIGRLRVKSSHPSAYSRWISIACHIKCTTKGRTCGIISCNINVKTNSKFSTGKFQDNVRGFTLPEKLTNLYLRKPELLFSMSEWNPWQSNQQRKELSCGFVPKRSDMCTSVQCCRRVF